MPFRFRYMAHQRWSITKISPLLCREPQVRFYVSLVCIALSYRRTIIMTDPTSQCSATRYLINIDRVRSCARPVYIGGAYMPVVQGQRGLCQESQP